MPPLTGIICLANSIKHGAHCIAGINPDNGSWIRPVSGLDDGRIERNERLVNGKEPQLGDFIYVPLADSGSDFGFEKENLFLLPGKWQFERKIDPVNILALCSEKRSILHNRENYVTVEYLQSLPFKERYTLQLVEAFEFSVFSTGLSMHGGHKWKASFISSYGEPLIARITDPVLMEKLETGYMPQQHCLVTVSLSMPWKPEDWEKDEKPCWKLIAGVIEFNETKETPESTGFGNFEKKPALHIEPLIPEKDDIDRKELLNTLHKVFGFKLFLPGQEDIIRAILNNKDAFVVMPTGAGKSLCYQLPAFLKSGACVVISPLISLMKDQVDAANDIGLNAAFLNSSQSEKERIDVIRKLFSGRLDLIYVAPERIAIETFFNNLKRLNISFVAIDEAHCISEWGHDFRPDYLFLSEIIKEFPHLPVAAFTATATKKVQQDIVDKLGLRNPYTVRASFNRPNLYYKVVPKENVKEQILNYVSSNTGQSGIVYHTTRKGVENTVLFLEENGVHSLPYHAGLGNGIRKRNQEAFNRDEVDIIVATVAFGMGIDKSNVRYVLHGDLPKSIENYYQETGRAGRDGEPAQCVLFFSRGDIPKIRYFIDKIETDVERIRAQSSLNAMISYAAACVCRRQRMLAYFGESFAQENCGACDICTGDAESIEATRDAQIVLCAVVRTEERFGAVHIADIVTGADTKKIRSFRHNMLKTYGAGKDHRKQYWRQMIDNLIAQNCLKVGGDKYPILYVTEKGHAVIRNKMEIYILKQKEIKKIKDTVREKHQDIVDYDTGLFEELRILRRSLASKQEVPPYIIFSDRTLHEMAYYFPTSETGMLSINGVGENKLEKYGADFIDLISNYANAHPENVLNFRNKSAEIMQKPIEYTSNITDTIETTWDLIKRGMPVEEIAEKRSLAIGTIYSHIERLILGNREINIDDYIEEQNRLRIEKMFNTLNTESLSSIVNASNNTVTYEDARLVRAWLKKN